MQVKQAQLNESLEAENLNQARYNRLPNLTTGPQASFNFGRNIDPSTNQYVTQSIFGLNGNIASQVLLYQGGLLKNQILESKLLLDVDKSNTAKIKNDLTLNVVTTYLQVLANQDLLKAATQQVDIANQALYRAQKNFDVGNNTLADLSQAKATVSTSQLNQTTAQNQLDVSILTLKQYMEFNPMIQITVEKPDISKLTDVKSQYNAQAVYTSALSVNPDVRLAELQKQAAYQNIKIAKSYYYPSLGLFGSIGSNYSNARNLVTALPTGGFNPIGVGKVTRDTIFTPAYRQIINKYPFKQQFSDNFNQSIGLSLQLPIFGKFATRTLVRRARISY